MCDRERDVFNMALTSKSKLHTDTIKSSTYTNTFTQELSKALKRHILDWRDGTVGEVLDT